MPYTSNLRQCLGIDLVEQISIAVHDQFGAAVLLYSDAYLCFQSKPEPNQLTKPAKYHKPAFKNLQPKLHESKTTSLAALVDRSLSGWSLGRDIRLGHTTINDKVRAVHEAALVAGQEQDRLSLFNSLTETTRREVDLATQTLGLVVAQPVLEKRCVQRCRAEGIESVALLGVYDGELARHG